jgi:hypothetical protein
MLKITLRKILIRLFRLSNRTPIMNHSVTLSPRRHAQRNGNGGKQ